MLHVLQISQKIFQNAANFMRVCEVFSKKNLITNLITCYHDNMIMLSCYHENIIMITLLSYHVIMIT
jgi:hypothetical protein